jgi:hypothetical protein
VKFMTWDDEPLRPNEIFYERSIEDVDFPSM